MFKKHLIMFVTDPDIVKTVTQEMISAEELWGELLFILNNQE